MLHRLRDTQPPGLAPPMCRGRIHWHVATPRRGGNLNNEGPDAPPSWTPALGQSSSLALSIPQTASS